MRHCVLLHFGQGTSSCLEHLQESQGHKTHQVPNLFIFMQGGHWKAFWHWHLLSISAGLHGRWLCAPHIQDNWISLRQRVPKPQLLLGAFLPPPSRPPCPKQQWGGQHLHAVLVRKDQTFPRGEAPMCCCPSCSLWLHRDRTTLRCTGAQAMFLLPTTTACAASTRCRRYRARFCTNLG